MDNAEPGRKWKRESHRESQCVVLFTKPAVAGRVKTRLVSAGPGGLDSECAAAFHSAFVGDLSEELLRGSFALRVAWDLRDGERPADEILAAGVAGFRQEGEDLGARLLHALRELTASHDAVAAIGSDHPTLSARRVEEAFERLEEGFDVAIGPATDGGYYLIAVRGSALQPGLFEEIEWSTSRVLEQTLERCRELGLRVYLLEPASDVDHPEDLVCLASELAGFPTGRCPRTRKLMAEWQQRSMAATEERR